MELLYIRHDYRYWSKILFGTIPTTDYDLEVKVTDLEIYVKVLSLSFFKISSFLNPCMNLLSVWHDYRHCSKILISSIHAL